MKKFFLWVFLLIYQFGITQGVVINSVFPEAKGFGAEWIFDQDYEVIIVTNLNDKGKGSLRDAILCSTTHAAKIIVFNGLSGTIELKSTIEFAGGKQVYLAGQTSENGILIKGSDFDGALLTMGWAPIDGVIIRGITLARGSAPSMDAGNGDCLQVGYNASNVIIDHCTLLWSTDEIIQIWSGGNNITIQNCLIGEGLQSSTHPKGNHSCGFIVGSNDDDSLPNRISVYNNLFTQNNTRNPVFYKVGEKVELVRNIVYNAKSLAIDALHTLGFKKELNLINNYAIDGNNTHIKGAYIGIDSGVIFAYAKGNISSFRSSSNTEWEAIRNRSDRYETAPMGQQSLTPYDYPLKGETIITHTQLLENQSSISGVGTFTRNSTELRLIDDVNNRTGGIIDDPSDVGGYPNIFTGLIITDVGNNGIPDSVEGNWNDDTFGYVNSIVNQGSNISINASAGSDQAICQGESVTLTASGGSSYSWNTGATTKSITVNPNETTTYTVKVSDGSASDSDSVQVTVNNVTANAGVDKIIYEGESVTLIASGGDSYVWNTEATSKSITVSPQETQNYTLTAYKNGCEDSDTVQVTVNKKDTSPPPAKANAGEDQTICLGDNIKLTASGGTTYVWSAGETTRSIYVNPTRTTSYTVTATRGGVTNSDVVVVTVENCSRVSDDTQDELFNVYPNPTKGEINISLKNVTENIIIFVSDAKGSHVYSAKTDTKQGEFYKKIDLSKLEKGIYFVRLNSAKINLVKKIIYSK